MRRFGTPLWEDAMHVPALVPSPVAPPAPAPAPAEPVTAAAAPTATTASEILSPVSGTVEALSQVNDVVFSQKMMGDGAAVIPTDGTIHAPVTGTITVAYETKHAYGLTADDGTEVLIHVGLDTVNLKGQHFTTQVAQGQHVNAGEILGTADLAAIKAAGYDPTVMVVITNSNQYQAIEPLASGTVNAGNQLLAAQA